MLRTGRLLPRPAGLLTLGFNPARFQAEPPACYRAPWRLPGQDSHLLATTSLCWIRSAQTTTSNAGRTAEKVERLRATETALCPLLDGKPPEADQTRLLGVEREPEPGQALLQVASETLGVGLMLKPQHEIIGIPHDDHLAAGVPRPPLLDPQIEHVVQVDVRQQR
jgi:hypothetical protein